MSSLKALKWQNSCGEWFKPLESVKGWKKCKQCKMFPRVWIFDNGIYAKCHCFDLYESGVQSESIMSVYRRTGNTAEYSRDNLRLAWNDYVINGNKK